MIKTKFIHIRATTKFKKLVDKTCKEQDVTLSWLVTQFLKDYVSKYGGNGKK